MSTSKGHVFSNWSYRLCSLLLFEESRSFSQTTVLISEYLVKLRQDKMFSDSPKSAAQNCSCGCLKKYPMRASLSVAGCAIVTALYRKATQKIIKFIFFFVSPSGSQNFVKNDSKEIISYICQKERWNCYLFAAKPAKLRQRLTLLGQVIQNAIAYFLSMFTYPVGVTWRACFQIAWERGIGAWDVLSALLLTPSLLCFANPSSHKILLHYRLLPTHPPTTPLISVADDWTERW